MSEDIIEHDEPIHDWFELTYANYLVLPRSVLQSAPVWWQKKFVQLLEELHPMFGDIPQSGKYEVHLRGEDGRYKEDDLADYERGRRRIPMDKTVIEFAEFLRNIGPNRISRFHARGICK